MILKRIIVIMLFLALLPGNFTFVSAEDTQPSNYVIQNWWKQHAHEEMEIAGKPVLIGLRSKEKAYLLPVYFVQRGRNEFTHTVLVRPKLKTVREVNDPVRQDSIVHDLNHDGISEIETTALGSGQGITQGIKSIVQFNGWNPIILHQTEFHENLGCCGHPPAGCGQCLSIEVKWKFVDLDGDGSEDLIEEIIIMSGPHPDELSTETKINKYLFKNNTFTKIRSNLKTE